MQTLQFSPRPDCFACARAHSRHKAELKAKLGWRDPRGLKCYSKDGTYVDLYVYFDAKDKVSDLNVAATKVCSCAGGRPRSVRVAHVPNARDSEQGTSEGSETDVNCSIYRAFAQAFKCYGLDGAQFAMDWDEIHGSAVVVREKPPMVGCSSSFGGPSSSLKQHSAPFNPLITADEMVDTLLFFKDKNAAKIAQRRDAQRTGQSRRHHSQQLRPFCLNLFPATPIASSFSHGGCDSALQCSYLQHSS